jgi:methionyl-tRNA synthetase
MAAKILVAVAWPYANGPLHVGHLAGAYLPADIFARYQRLKGNHVLMVSGSDCHGTPIALKAEADGTQPQEVIRRYHESFLETFRALGISFDLFTQTYTANHYAVVQDIFRRLLEKGLLHEKSMTGCYSESLGRFLPDRFVEGTCPRCGFASARGDQCDRCGSLYDAHQLGAPRSKLDGKSITFRPTAHYVFDLPALAPRLRDWLEGQDRSHWRENTLTYTENWLAEGLDARAITRDLEWGVPVPVADPKFANKRIYVWFDAVIGYYSASIEWARRLGNPERWRDWWTEGDVRPYYFIGKDNIPFHTIIWPAILLTHGDLALPYDVPANEFLNLEGEKMSTSRNWALWCSDIQDRYAPDQIRYYLAANAPEGRDSNWSWQDFVRRNNDELLATWGNLANRVLQIAYREFGRIPEPGELTAEDLTIIRRVDETFGEAGSRLDAVRLKAALQQVMSLAQDVNRYMTEQEPWRLIKTDRRRGATVIYTGLQLLQSLNTLFSPFLPWTSQQLHEMLGCTGSLATQPFIETAEDLDGKPRHILTGQFQSEVRWKATRLPPAQPLDKPRPLFRKLEKVVGEQELERLRTSESR